MAHGGFKFIVFPPGLANAQLSAKCHGQSGGGWVFDRQCVVGYLPGVAVGQHASCSADLNAYSNAYLNVNLEGPFLQALHAGLPKLTQNLWMKIAQPSSSQTLLFKRREALGLCLGVAVSPWAHAQSAGSHMLDDTWHDSRRQRVVLVRVRWPVGTPPEGGWSVVIYSHGLGGTRASGSVWGQAWSDAGFVVLHVQHPGSDLDAVRAVANSFTDKAALRSLGTAGQLLTRMQDVVFAIDEIARRKTTDTAWRLVRTDAVGMAGHSFGAHTTLGVGGQAFPRFAGMHEPRIAALVPLSPSVPVRGEPVKALAAVTQPTLCITGTLDDDMLGNGVTPDKRASVFAALPSGHKALLLLAGADHMSFGGMTGRDANIVPRQTLTTALQAQHHALVASITTDWWRAHLQGDMAAKNRLLMPQGLGDADVWRVG